MEVLDSKYLLVTADDNSIIIGMQTQKQGMMGRQIALYVIFPMTLILLISSFDQPRLEQNSAN